MLKKILALILNKVGIVSLALRIAEFILEQVNMTWDVPYPGYTKDIVEQVQKIAEDDKITSKEIAEVIRYFRVNKE